MTVETMATVAIPTTGTTMIGTPTVPAAMETAMIATPPIRTATSYAPTPRTGPGSTAPAGSEPQRAAGPLRRVLAALEGGAAERAALVRMTGLGDDAVDAALAHLVRLGHVRTGALSAACPAAGCGACPSARSGATSSCGAGVARRAGAPVVLSLVRRPAE